MATVRIVLLILYRKDDHGHLVVPIPVERVTGVDPLSEAIAPSVNLSCEVYLVIRAN